MSSILPTIGRKVYFYDQASGQSVAGAMGRYDEKTPFDATVIYVWGPTCVNLRVTDHDGKTHVRTSVPLRDPSESDGHGKEYVATWMPYQVGQARASSPEAETPAPAPAPAPQAEAPAPAPQGTATGDASEGGAPTSAAGA